MSTPFPAPDGDASATKRGLVNLLAQTFAGIKTFAARVILSADLQFADATVQSTAGLSPAVAAATYITPATVAATYLPTATAASTYLPLAGGALTGALAVNMASASKVFTFGGVAGSLTRCYITHSQGTSDSINIEGSGGAGGGANLRLNSGTLAVGSSGEMDYGRNGLTATSQSVAINLTQAQAGISGKWRSNTTNGQTGWYLGTSQTDGANSATAKLLRIVTDITGTPVDKFVFEGNGRLTTTYGDTTGTAGAATSNTNTGKSKLASGATSVVITNSLVSATSCIQITPIDIDANITKWKAVAGSGSFTVTVDAAAAADWKFQWETRNP